MYYSQNRPNITMVSKLSRVHEHSKNYKIELKYLMLIILVMNAAYHADECVDFGLHLEWLDFQLLYMYEISLRDINAK